jgi:glycosyltransferase involved in cell wall biosynthesis
MRVLMLSWQYPPHVVGGLGIVALEAMAAKCPIIVSQPMEPIGLKEVVRCCQSGVTVRPGDPESLARGIVRVLTQPDLAQSWAATAYQLVRDKYNWDRIATLTAVAYERAHIGR